MPWPSKAHREMVTRSGFTLLEVLVALAIVATAWAGIAAVLPRLLGPAPAVRAADTLEQLLREARAAAAEGRSPVLVRLAGNGGAVAVPALGVQLPLPQGVSAHLEGVTGWGGGGAINHGAGAGALHGGDGAAIVFLPDGSSSGGRVTLSETAADLPAGLDGKAGSVEEPTVSVHVAWLTGRIERRP